MEVFCPETDSKEDLILLDSSPELNIEIDTQIASNRDIETDYSPMETFPQTPPHHHTHRDRHIHKDIN